MLPAALPAPGSLLPLPGWQECGEGSGHGHKARSRSRAQSGCPAASLPQPRARSGPRLCPGCGLASISAWSQGQSGPDLHPQGSAQPALRRNSFSINYTAGERLLSAVRPVEQGPEGFPGALFP